MIRCGLTRPVLVAVLCLLMASAALQPRVTAATTLVFTVTTSVDSPDAYPGDGVCADASNQCSLRAAIQETDLQPRGSTIGIVLPGGTYPLSQGPLRLSANATTITGAGVPTTTVDGLGSSLVLSVTAAAVVTLTGVTLTNGNGGRQGSGGGVANAGTLILRDSAIVDSQAERGGGVYNAGRLWLLRSTVAHNAASSGGGIANTGTATISQTLVAQNTATTGDGGGLTNSGWVTMAESRISGNSAPGQGGGVDNAVGGYMDVIRSALTTNSALSGGGIYNTGSISVQSSILAANSAPFGLSQGGGLCNDYPGSMRVTSSLLRANTAYAGGGIENAGGSLALTRSSVLSNTADAGGGIANSATLRVVSSTLSLNRAATFYGGGIDNTGTLSVTGSTLTANAAPQGRGGGIDNEHLMAVTDSTISANSALTGGGIYNYNPDTDYGVTGAALSYDTIVANTDGLNNDTDLTTGGPATLVLTGTLVANSTTGPNCSGAITEDQGYNLDSSATCGFTQTTDLTNTNPLLGPLANNGGLTPTMALLSGSPAIDRGGTSANGCPSTDQRGVTRPQGAACDIGAYEAGGGPKVNPPGSRQLGGRYDATLCWPCSASARQDNQSHLTETSSGPHRAAVAAPDRRAPVRPAPDRRPVVTKRSSACAMRATPASPVLERVCDVTAPA